MNSPSEWIALIDRYGGIIVCLLGLLYLLFTGRLFLAREVTRLEAENAALRAKVSAADETLQRAVATTWQMVGTVRELARTPPSDPPAAGRP